MAHDCGEREGWSESNTKAGPARRSSAAASPACMATASPTSKRQEKALRPTLAARMVLPMQNDRTTRVWKIQGVALDFHCAVFQKSPNLPRPLSATKMLDHLSDSSCHVVSRGLFSFSKSPITHGSKPFSPTPPPTSS